MKRAVVTALFLSSAAALSGCPIYDHEDAGCYRDSDCADGYLCDDNSGACFKPSSQSAGNSCHQPIDCGTNETCSKTGVCVSGDCSFSGCVSGYTCDSSTGKWACLANDSGAAGAAGSTNEAGAAGALNAAGAAGESASVGGAAGSN